jgi:hypothetical protein
MQYIFKYYSYFKVLGKNVVLKVEGFMRRDFVKIGR